VTSDGQDGPEFEPQGGRNFPNSTSPAPRPTQPAAQGAPRQFRGVKRPVHRDNLPPSSDEVESGLFILVRPFYDYQECYGIACTRCDRTVDRDLPVDRGRFLVSIKIY
jgi:hypothetical protein